MNNGWYFGKQSEMFLQKLLIFYLFYVAKFCRKTLFVRSLRSREFLSKHKHFSLWRVIGAWSRLWGRVSSGGRTSLSCMCRWWAVAEFFPFSTTTCWEIWSTRTPSSAEGYWSFERSSTKSRTLTRTRSQLSLRPPVWRAGGRSRGRGGPHGDWVRAWLVEPWMKLMTSLHPLIYLWGCPLSAPPDLPPSPAPISSQQTTLFDLPAPIRVPYLLQ